MRFDVARLDAALRPLVGLPAWGIEWAADMLMLQFGPPVVVTNQFGPRKGQSRTVGQYALHIQCAWEIRGPGARVGLYDERSHRAGARAALTGDHRVRSATADVTGGLRLVLEGAFSVTAAPLGDGEYWRVFHSGDTSRHFVVGFAGIEA